MALLITGCGAPAQQVHLNHAFSVLDADTFTAIQENEFVTGELAATRSRTTHADHGESWTGFYLYGRHTYLELFGPGATAGPEGTCGIGLGVDHPGELDALATRLAAEGHPLKTGLRTRVEDGKETPWFRMGYFPDDPDGGGLTMWVMEYANGSDRETYLRPRQVPGRLLVEVRGVRMAMPALDRAHFAAEVTRFGWVVRLEGDSVIAELPEATVRVDLGPRPALLELRLELAHPVPHRELHLGRSTLVVGPGSEAVWHF
jgi:hypothetical protein